MQVNNYTHKNQFKRVLSGKKLKFLHKTSKNQGLQKFGKILQNLDKNLKNSNSYRLSSPRKIR